MAISDTQGILDLETAQTPQLPSAGLRKQARAFAPGPLFMNGEWRPAQNDATYPNINPATGEVTTLVAEGTTADLDAAVAAAKCFLIRVNFTIFSE